MCGQTHIYGLLCPIEDKIKYVGKSNRPEERLKEHLRSRCCTPKGKWIASLRERGAEPRLVILQTVPADNWRDAERQWIDHFRIRELPLVNTALMPTSPVGVQSKHVSQNWSLACPELQTAISSTATKGSSICSVDNCGRTSVARSWCAAHWKRWKKYGDPLHGKKLPLFSGAVCRAESCASPACTDGYCAAHHARYLRHGDPNGGKKSRSVPETSCSIEGCERPSRARGLCNAHYKRLRIHGDALGGGPPAMKGKSLADRHAAYTDRRGPDECWPWMRGTSERGHGAIQDGRRNRPAHCVAYELALGSITEGYQVHHICENPACQNPNHLQAMKAGEHTLVGRNFSGANAQKTHCKWGHALTPENSYGYYGRRQCKTCARQKARERHLRNKSPLSLT